MTNDELGFEFTENAKTKRYFAKFAKIIGILSSISEKERSSGGDFEYDIIIDELKKLSNTFEALSMKYLFTGIVQNKLPSNLAIDTTDSGFPMFGEIVQLENDIAKAEEEIGKFPSEKVLKQDMIDHILKYKTIPRDLQFAMSQLKYYQMLVENRIFCLRNKPNIVPIGINGKFHRYLVHWSVYDTAKNFPNIYIMILEDSNEITLPDDEEKLERFNRVVLNQSISTLKMVTIAMAIDKEFPKLHPKSLRRIYVGPMYSNAFTSHNDNIQSILEGMGATSGKDWIFSWTIETLVSKKTESIKKGLFGEQLKEIYYIDKHDVASMESGSTDVIRHMILPYEVYQCLIDNPSNPLNGIMKHVVDLDGQIITNV